MNFNQLKYIVAVDRFRNFARAAGECGVAQSTLSKEIQRLEKEFGVMIFDRSRFPVVPTIKGSELIGEAKKILEGQGRFAAIAAKRDNEPQGHFRLALLPDIAPYLLPLFIERLAEKYPALTVEVTEYTAREMLAGFEQDQLDGAVAIAPFVRQGYYEEALFDERFVLYVSAGHRLYGRNEVDPADVPWEELLLPDSYRDYFLPGKSGTQLPGLPGAAHVRYHSGSPETIRKIIDRNGGLTLLPELACLYMGERRLAMVRTISPSFIRQIIFVTPRGFQKNRIIKVIKKEIIGNLPKAAGSRRS
jgi:LysR family hydrogen peroxide-inducible transcriptional activator